MSGDNFQTSSYQDGPLQEGCLQDGSLQDAVDSGPVRWPAAVDLAHHLAQLVSEIHADGNIHTNINPYNVVLSSDGSMQLVGFPQADSKPRSAYAPPEVLAGERCLHALHTGRPPNWQHSPSPSSGVLMSVLVDPLPRWDLPRDTPCALRNLLICGLARDPRYRPRNASALMRMLDEVRAGGMVGAPTSLVGYTLASQVPPSIDLPKGDPVQLRPLPTNG